MINAMSSETKGINHLRQACFFNIFEKTQAQKNSRFEKTQGNFSPKLNETVVTSNGGFQNFRSHIFVNFCAQNCKKTTTYLLKSQLFAKRRPFDAQKICCTLKMQIFV